ncbi:epoxide hydrolase, soluble (sEH) [Lambiella insularis]|nr:epoxide hydrolase, soluble (sEH) [Lambiella insularis]
MVQQGFQSLAHNSNDVVLAAHFNDHGTRLVTGSADHRIRVFDSKQGNWKLTDLWRGHNGAILDIKWNGSKTGQVLGSIGEDLRLKVWQEEPTEARHSGRRFKCIFAQSSGHSVVYNSLDFVNPNKDTFLAVVTRDGLLSLLEPVNPEKFDDWREIDQILVCDEHISRGVETSFKLSFQQAESFSVTTALAGQDQVLNLAVTAMAEVKIFRLERLTELGRQEQYKFQDPVAVLSQVDGLVRDVAWSQEVWRLCDWIATAASDGYVRVYELSRSKQDPLRVQTDLTLPRRATIGTADGNSKTSTRGPSGIGAGLAGASLAGSIASHSLGQVKCEARLVEQMKHEGVWEVQWVRYGHALLSSGDSGSARMWKQAHNGKWHEFAEFSPEHNN